MRPMRTGSTSRRKSSRTYLDFVFIAAYAAFLVLAGAVASRTRGRWAGAIIISAAIAAALFDVFENLASLRVLTEHTGTPRAASLWKWRFFFIAVGGLVPLLIDWPSTL